MSVDLHALIPLIALTFLLAGFVKGVVGLGLPTVSVGLLGLAMPPMQAAALLIVPSMVTNLWQLACGPRFLGLMKRLAGLLLGWSWAPCWSAHGSAATHQGRPPACSAWPWWPTRCSAWPRSRCTCRHATSPGPARWSGWRPAR